MRRWISKISEVKSERIQLPCMVKINTLQSLKQENMFDLCFLCFLTAAAFVWVPVSCSEILFLFSCSQIVWGDWDGEDTLSGDGVRQWRWVRRYCMFAKSLPFDGLFPHLFPLVLMHRKKVWTLLSYLINAFLWQWCPDNNGTLLLSRRSIWLSGGSRQNEGEGSQGQVQAGESSASQRLHLSSLGRRFHRMHQDQASSPTAEER